MFKKENLCKKKQSNYGSNHLGDLDFIIENETSRFLDQF